MKIKQSIIFCIGLLIWLSGCQIKKFIPENELLYTGATLEIEKPDDIEDFKSVEEELNGLLRPEPNSKFLGMYVGLWSYYKSQKDKPGFIIRFMNKKFGEEPVYMSQVNPSRTEELILNRLENRGFFYGTATSEETRGKKFAEVTYSTTVSHP